LKEEEKIRFSNPFKKRFKENTTADA